MPTLILPSRYSSDTIKLWRAALTAGWRAERLQSWHPPVGLRDQNPVIYGEPMFTQAVAKALDLILLEPTLNWLAELPHRYLNRRVNFMTFGEADRITETTFIKPADDKCFPASVYRSGMLLLDDYQLPTNVPILLSEPVDWEVEYRCFIRDNQVMTLSPYLRGGELIETKDEMWPVPAPETAEAEEFAARFLADPETKFPPAGVLDVGKIRERGWSVIEANPAWSSGIYGCDTYQVLLVLKRACLAEAELTPSDSFWMVDRQSLE